MSKSVILPHRMGSGSKTQGGDPRRALHLWILNPLVSYASSLVDGKRQAMKVLYQTIDAEKGNALADSMSSDVQDVSLPASVIETVHIALEFSNTLLPLGERNFKEWKVGLIERWVHDSSIKSFEN